MQRSLVIIAAAAVAIAADAVKVDWRYQPTEGCPLASMIGAAKCASPMPRARYDLHAQGTELAIQTRDGGSRCCTAGVDPETGDCMGAESDSMASTLCMYADYVCEAGIEVTAAEDPRCVTTYTTQTAKLLWVGADSAIRGAYDRYGNLVYTCLDGSGTEVGAVTEFTCHNEKYLPNGPLHYGMNRVASNPSYDYVFIMNERNGIYGEHYRIFQVQMPTDGTDVYVWWQDPLPKPAVTYTMSTLNSKSAMVSLHTVDEYGFIMRIDQSPFCESPHTSEIVNIFAVASGSYKTEDGQQSMVAGTVPVDSSEAQIQQIQFETPLTGTPIMHASVQRLTSMPENATFAVARTYEAKSTAMKVGITGSRTFFCTPSVAAKDCQNNEPYDFKTAKVEIAYIAFVVKSFHQGLFGDVRYWTATNNRSIGKVIETLDAPATFDGEDNPSNPIVFANIQTAAGRQVGVTRVKKADLKQVVVNFNQDTCQGREVNEDMPEQVAVIVFEGPPTDMREAPPSDPPTDAPPEFPGAPVPSPDPENPEPENPEPENPEPENPEPENPEPENPEPENPEPATTPEPVTTTEPEAVCEAENVHLELIYLQENSLTYCGAATCPYADGGDAQIAKQDAIKANLFNTIDALADNFASVKISYNEFCDKNIEPFGQADLDFCFKFFNSLVPYNTEYRAWIEDHWSRRWDVSASGRDRAENQLDAIISTVMRSSFSTEDTTADGKRVLRLAVMMTDKIFHTYGDVQSLFPECKDDSGNELCAPYTPSADTCQCVGTEYPQVTQVVDVLAQHKVNLVTMLGTQSSTVSGAFDALNVALTESGAGVVGATLKPSPSSTLGEFDGEAMKMAVEAVCKATA